jgi:hypothetical protein
MSIDLPPAPPVNRDIPVITSAGASSAAYNDPTSPESIMKKTTLVQAQGITDTRFDVPEDAFKNYSVFQTIPLWLIFNTFLILLLLLPKSRIRGSYKLVLFFTLLFLLLLSMKKKNEL